MTTRDLQQIEKLFNRTFSEVWNNNLEPAFTVVYERIDKVESRVDNLERKVDNLEVKVDSLQAKVDNLPTKSYIDDKISNLRVEFKKKI